MKPIMHIWLGQEYKSQPDYFIGFLFVILGCAMIFNSVFSSLSNGLGRLKIQAIFFGIRAVIKIPLAYLFVYILNSWTGVILANVVSISLFCIVQPFFIKKYLF